ncbi:hypothetical protein Tco_0510788 [Tanacetum coccineum]
MMLFSNIQIANSAAQSNVWGTQGKVSLTSFRNAIGANYLTHSRDYTQTPSIEDVSTWFPSIWYGESIKTKGTLRKAFLPPRWILLMVQVIECLGGKIGGFDQISNKDAMILYCLAKGVNIDFVKLIEDGIISKVKKKNREKVIPYLRFLSLLLELRMEGYGTNNVTCILTQIFSINNLILKKGQPEGPPFTNYMLAICKADTPVAFKAPRTSSHNEKKDSQGKPLELRCDASADSTAEADPRKSTPIDSLPPQQGRDEGTKNYSLKHIFVDEASKTIKLVDLAKLVSNVKVDFMNLDSLEDDLVIILEESEGEDEVDKDKGIHFTLNVETEDTSASKPPSPISIQLQELTNQVFILQSQKHKLEHEKNKVVDEVDLLRSSLPTELKELPTKFNDLVEDVKGLKKQVHELEIKFLGDLKENPFKREDFTKTITSHTSQVAELKTLQWELPAEFDPLPKQVASVQAKQKTLDALPSMLQKVTEALNSLLRKSNELEAEMEEHMLLMREKEQLVKNF